MTLEQKRPLRVLCVDDNEMVAEALRRRLASESGLEWAGVVVDGAAACSRVLDESPDVVLMDIDMPGVDAFEIVERLAAEAPRVRVIMFSGYVDRRCVERALDCGAWGYLSKNEDVGWLIEAIERVGRGEIILSREAEAARGCDAR